MEMACMSPRWQALARQSLIQTGCFEGKGDQFFALFDKVVISTATGTMHFYKGEKHVFNLSPDAQFTSGQDLVLRGFTGQMEVTGL